MINTIKNLLIEQGIACREMEDKLRIDLPNAFGELEIGVFGDDGTIVGLVGYPWHTHGDVLMYYAGADEAEAISSFVTGIFEGHYCLVELLKDGNPVDKYIDDDRHSVTKYLQAGEAVKLYN